MMRSFLIATCLLLFAQDCRADVITLEVNSRSFLQGSGTRVIDISVLRTTTLVPLENATGFIAGFDLPDGGKFVEADSFFGAPGYLGAGQLSNSSSIAVDPVETFLALSLDFSSAISFPTTKTTAGTLAIDISNLAPGTYRLRANEAEYNTGIFPSRISGTFEIVAVPEPSSLLLVLSTTGAAFVLKRRGWRRKAV